MWFSRRTNYMLSHAVMCVAGYILGLGDRHPSNLMLNQVRLLVTNLIPTSQST